MREFWESAYEDFLQAIGTFHFKTSAILWNLVMAQIGLLIVAYGLASSGIHALRGKEDPEKKQTPKGVAIGMFAVAAFFVVGAILLTSSNLG